MSINPFQTSKALQEWIERRDFLESKLAKEADATQQFKLQKEIKDCNENIETLQKRKPYKNQGDTEEPKPPIKTLIGVGGAILVFVFGAIVMFGGHNPPPAPSPSQGTKSEPQTTSEQNSETSLKKWCLDMKQQAERTGGAEYINEVKKQMESKNCSSLGVSLP